MESMQERKLIFGKIFLTISSVGAFFVLAEIILVPMGRSICFTEGCKVVVRQARYGDISILLLGFIVFLLFALFSALSQYRAVIVLEQYINVLLIVSLCAEGFFTGYQVFAVKSVCLFCLAVFGLIVALGVIRLLAGEKIMIAGFASLAAIYCLFYLIPPAGVTVSLPENEQVLLFYSKDCKYCAEVKQELERGNINVTYVDVNEYAGLLKNIGIESVPTLVVNNPYQKVFLVGAGMIKQYLDACKQDKIADKGPLAKKQQKKSGTTKGLTIISPQNLFTGPAVTQSGGFCKEDEICK